MITVHLFCTELSLYRCLAQVLEVHNKEVTNDHHFHLEAAISPNWKNLGGK